MNRRSFITLVATVAVAPCLPVAAVVGVSVGEIGTFTGFRWVPENSRSRFNPQQEYGSCVRVVHPCDFPYAPITPRATEKVKAQLIDNMKTIIPPWYRHLVTYGFKACDYGRYHVGYWHYTPKSQSKKGAAV